jgi:anaerobic selenocysteine-containing dehydrogenase
MPPLPDHFRAIEETDAEHPFRLVTAPARNFLNSTFTETPSSRKREGRPTALIHTQDAAALGLADGDIVTLGNRRGRVRIHARVFDGLRPGVVVVESIWPNADFVDAIGINALVGDDPAPPNGGAVFHDSAVWIRPG